MSRHYKKNGKKFPSCTTIISDCTNSSNPLMQYAANMVVEWIRENCEDLNRTIQVGYAAAESTGGYNIESYRVTMDELNDARFNFRKVSQKALDIGSQVHTMIEQYLKTDTWQQGDTEEAETAFAAFLEWEEEVNLKPIALEQTVWGSRWAGTLDFYGYYKDKLYVIDWKTSKPANKKTGKGIRPEMRYQVAAYRWGLGLNEVVEGCGVLRLDKETGMPEFKDTTKTYEQDLRVFNRMVDLYIERHAGMRKQFSHLVPF